MNYTQAIRYLESFINYEKIPTWSYKESLKLKRIKGFLDYLGNPQDELRCIHIAGTKGKGSTCAFIAYILRQAGFKTGLYTSPHLSNFRERIRVLQKNKPSNSAESSPPKEFEGMIPERGLVECVKIIKPYVERFNRHHKLGPLSFFEVYTALAFVYFRKEKVDFAVLETGLGGRLDATNTVDSLVSVITPISYEHTQKLGNTLGEIAEEKAGIIKRPSQKQPLLTISAPQTQEAGRVIREKRKSVGARLYEIGKDIKVNEHNGKFDVKGIFAEYKDLKIKLLGSHQVINAAAALAAIETLHFSGVKINKRALRNGLAEAIWPGRCEVVSRKPLIILDGAQNVASAQSLKDTVESDFKYNRLILLLGISKDKDIEGVCRTILPMADEVILTSANNPRAALTGYLKKKIKTKLGDVHFRIHTSSGVREGLFMAIGLAGSKDLILVTGSLFVVGEARDCLQLYKNGRLLFKRYTHA